MEAAAARRAMEAGNRAYDNRSYEEAVEHYTRGEDLDPTDISFLTRRADAYFAMEEFEECLADNEEAVRRGRSLGATNEQIARALSGQASALLKLADEYAPAIQALEQSLDLHDIDETRTKLADCYRKTGNAFFKEENFREAARHYTQAIERNPMDRRVFSRRAQCSILLRRKLPRGLEDAEKCIELDPTVLKGYVLKAEIQSLMEDYENALETYLEGLRCDPNDLEVLDGLRRCAASIASANGVDVELMDLKEMLENSEDDDWHESEAMEEVDRLKKKASDERAKRIEAEKLEQLEQLQVEQDEVTEKLRRAKQRNEGLQSEHDDLLRERDRAVREAEMLRQKWQSALVTSTHCVFSSSELQRATKKFSMKIGEGGFGCVYRGNLRKMTVAIKVLKPDSLQGQSQFEQEVAILSRVRHPHLVTLLGACPELSALVYEFLPNGSLEDFLASADKRRTLSWQIRFRIIAEICSALIFLHKNRPHPVLHGDLKPDNILLDANLVSKLSDFGISRLLNQLSANNTALCYTGNPVGTPGYIDPAFLATGELTPYSDVYSFGIVVLRLLTGRSHVGIKKIVEDAMQEGNLSSVVDASAGAWPDGYVQQLAENQDL